MEREAEDVAKSSKLTANRYLVLGTESWELECISAYPLTRAEKACKGAMVKKLRFLSMTCVKSDKTQCLAPFP